MSDPRAYLLETFEESVAAKRAFVTAQAADLVRAAEQIGRAIERGGKVLLCGNGGSAADAQHMAAEMVGEMIVKGRRALPAIALTTDTSNLTAVGNDFGFERVFAKQVEALGRAGDVLIAISTSGNSKNVLAAVELARARKLTVIGITGGSGGKLAPLCDIALCVREGRNSSRIQETHIFVVHSLVDLLDRYFAPASPLPGEA